VPEPLSALPVPVSLSLPVPEPLSALPVPVSLSLPPGCRTPTV
jgi:hypothetical protein